MNFCIYLKVVIDCCESFASQCRIHWPAGSCLLTVFEDSSSLSPSTHVHPHIRWRSNFWIQSISCFKISMSYLKFYTIFFCNLLIIVGILNSIQLFQISYDLFYLYFHLIFRMYQFWTLDFILNNEKNHDHI